MNYKKIEYNTTIKDGDGKIKFELKEGVLIIIQGIRFGIYKDELFQEYIPTELSTGFGVSTFSDNTLKRLINRLDKSLAKRLPEFEKYVNEAKETLSANNISFPVNN